MNKKSIIAIGLIAIMTILGLLVHRVALAKEAPTYRVAKVERGNVKSTVSATGTLNAVTTVSIGTQVSGQISELHADFNSLVKKGQVLARLDPSLFQTQIEQARANLARAQADLERLRVSLDDANTKLKRAKELSERQLLPKSELDAAEKSIDSDPGEAIRQARHTLAAAKSSRAFSIIARGFCRQGDLGNAKAALHSVGGADRPRRAAPIRP